MIVVSKAFGLQLGTLLRTALASQVDGPLFAVSIGLFTAGPDPITPDSVIGDFTPATFVGYAPLTAQQFSAAFLDQDDRIGLTSPLCTFTAGAIVTPETVLGYYVWKEGTPDVWLMGEYFQDADGNPITIVFNELGDGISFIINYRELLTGKGGHSFMP